MPRYVIQSAPRGSDQKIAEWGGRPLLFAAVQELNRAVIVLLLHIEDTRVLFPGARHGTPLRTGRKAIGVITRCRDSMIPEQAAISVLPPQ